MMNKSSSEDIFDPPRLDKSLFEEPVSMNSISTEDESSDVHLLQKELFDPDKVREITFVSAIRRPRMAFGGGQFKTLKVLLKKSFDPFKQQINDAGAVSKGEMKIFEGDFAGIKKSWPGCR